MPLPPYAMPPPLCRPPPPFVAAFADCRRYAAAERASAMPATCRHAQDAATLMPLIFIDSQLIAIASYQPMRPLAAYAADGRRLRHCAADCAALIATPLAS